VLLGDAPSPIDAGKHRLVSLGVLDELVSGPAEAAAYGDMRETISDALGPVREQSPLPFEIDDLYWAMRRVQAHEAWAAHGA